MAMRKGEDVCNGGGMYDVAEGDVLEDRHEVRSTSCR